MDLLAQMATFVRIVEGNSLSAAARSQRLSLPAVSRQLRALEADLGTSLIVRSTRRLRVTEAGRQWYVHCVRVLQDLEAARAEVRASKAVRGTLVISASLTFGAILLAPRLPQLADKYPHLVIDLRLEDHLVDLVAENVDIAIRAGAPPPDSTAFIAHPYMTMERIVVASPRWLRKHGTPHEPAQLARCECLMQAALRGARIPWRLRRASDPADEQIIDVRGHLHANAPMVLRDLAVAGAGVAYLPDWLVAGELANNSLRRVLPEWSSPPIIAWAVHRAELRNVPRVRAFLDAMLGDARAR